jgi:hypothetical protein
VTGHPTPRTDQDTHAVLDDALTALAQRRHAWLGEDTALIHLIASLTEQAERLLPEAVTNARAEGHTWTDPATLLGTSPHQARLRFDPDSPIADGRWPQDTT